MIKWLEKKRFISFLITALISIEIYYISSLEFAAGALGNPWPARIYHVMIFFLFGTFLFILIKGKKEVNIKNFAIVLTISIIYAILDEVHQLFVPGRNASIEDILTDSIGIFSSIIIYTYISKKQKESKKRLINK